jgi:hypothetical protein
MQAGQPSQLSIANEAMQRHAVRQRTNCPVSNLSLQSGSKLPSAGLGKSISVQTREWVGGMIDASRRFPSRDFGIARAIPTVCPSKRRGARSRQLPRLSGANASGNSFEELECNAQDRVQRMYDRSEHVIPVPNDDTYALLALDMDDGKGLWIFVEIDLACVVSRVPAHPQLYAEFDHQEDCDSAPAGVRSADDGMRSIADGDSHDRR